jgi:hypothetical protein
MPRKKERISVSLGVNLEWSSGRSSARVSDLSMSGCFVDTIAPVCEGETVSLKLAVSTGKTEAMVGEVVYHLAGFGFGLCFKNVSEEQKNLLKQIIVEHGGNPLASGDAPARSGRVIITGGDAAVLNLTSRALQAEGFKIITLKDARETYFQMQADADFAAVVFNVAADKAEALNLVRYMQTDKRLQHIPVVVSGENKSEVFAVSSAISEEIRDIVSTINQHKINRREVETV